MNNLKFGTRFTRSNNTYEYVPERCLNENCVTLLSGHEEDTRFVTAHIDEMNLYVRVIWFGNDLQRVINTLFNRFTENKTEMNAFIVLHWSPSEIIDTDIEYEMITMPQCELFDDEAIKNATCKYELTPVLKYCSEQFKKFKTAHSVFEMINFDRQSEKYLLEMYNNFTKVEGNLIDIHDTDYMEKVFDHIACMFHKEKPQIYEEWIQVLSIQMSLPKKRKIYIGGLYPRDEERLDEHIGMIE